MLFLSETPRLSTKNRVKCIEKNIPLFFLKTTVCFSDMYNLLCVILLILMICFLENAKTNQWGINKKHSFEIK